MYLEGLEPSTLRLSTVCSSHLSYRYKTWLGRQGSNLQSAISRTAALPIARLKRPLPYQLGHGPTNVNALAAPLLDGLFDLCFEISGAGIRSRWLSAVDSRDDPRRLFRLCLESTSR